MSEPERPPLTDDQAQAIIAVRSRQVAWIVRREASVSLPVSHAVADRLTDLGLLAVTDPARQVLRDELPAWDGTPDHLRTILQELVGRATMDAAR